MISFSTTASIFRSASVLSEPIRVSGASISVKALLVARYAQTLTQNQALDSEHEPILRSRKTNPIIVLCPNDEIAAEFCTDLECLSSTAEDAPCKARNFPTWDQSPYSPITLSLRTRHTRLMILSELVNDAPPSVIVTTLAASCQSTLPKNTFVDYTIFIQIDHSIQSREAFVARLVDAGYLRVDPVDDPGTFSVRGDIIDVYPIHKSKPIRIELFGDKIERVREFDPTTQRTTQSEAPIREIFIPPAREVMINPAFAPALREKLKQRADELGIPKKARDPLLSSIKDGSYSDHSDCWAPFAYDPPATLWDYLDSEHTVVWNDEMRCLQEWEEFRDAQEKLSESGLKSDLVAPPVSELYRWSDSLAKRIQLNSKLFFDPFELTSSNTPAGTLHRLSVTSNTDLVRGSRHSLGELESQIRLWLKQGYKILGLAFTNSQLQRIRFLLEERGLSCQMEGPLTPATIHLKMGAISQGFQWETEGLIVLSESEILGSKPLKKQKRTSATNSGSAAKSWSGLSALSDLISGDTVVHVDHGLGRYQGIVRLDLSGAPNDFLLLEYANKDRLYLPIYRLNAIQKYVGASDSITLDKLGSQQFARTKEKVREDVKKLAFNLVQLYAKRKIQEGTRFSPRDSDFREFEAQFPYDETPDQLKAIDAILSDMESGRVMDRLVCGDVGYGKTEVGIRAAFRAISDGKQVVVLVPTTVLAQQHEISFKSRLKDYPILIESLSRFKSAKEQKTILKALSQGKIDLIIGTHRLLSKDVQFHDLGLIIVDEEHRFGVEHKERLKTFKINTHVLTLTATPIPRTLHMALSGIRDISLINTPPIDRLPIRTYISRHDDALIKKAIEFELARGGQVFYLHNRVQTIRKTAQALTDLVPSAQVIVAHGQMPEHELEDTMLSFYQKRANVLVCTTLIESGLDLPSANTIIIDRADSLGLAQLYQIRGRVGRGQVRAYAYFLIPAQGAVSGDATRRLEVIQRFVELGSGFSIASHDLEIRGGGDLLGPQQSGNINAVGFDLYTELLEEAILEIQGQPHTEDSRREPEIKAPFPCYLSEEYVPDVHQRLSLYRRFSAISQDGSIEELEVEMRDRFGTPPVEAHNLLWLIRIKILLKKTGIDALTVGPEKVSLTPGKDNQFNPTRLIALVSAYSHQYQLMPDSRLVAKIPTHNLRDLYFGLETLLREFS
jgi:transcription-repair coupling factor (superfamily II helicase)